MSDFITLYHLTNCRDRLSFLDPKYCQPCEGGQKEGIYFVNSFKVCKEIKDHMLYGHNRVLYGPYMTKIQADTICYPDWRIDVVLRPDIIDDLADGLRMFYSSMQPVSGKIKFNLASHTAKWTSKLKDVKAPDLYNLDITELEFTKRECFVHYKDPKKKKEQKVELSSFMESAHLGVADSLLEFLCDNDETFRKQYNYLLQEAVKGPHAAIKYCNPNYAIPVIHYRPDANEPASTEKPSKPFLFDYDLSDLVKPKTPQTTMPGQKRGNAESSTVDTEDCPVEFTNRLLRGGTMAVLCAWSVVASCEIWQKTSPDSFQKAKNQIVQIIHKSKTNLKNLFAKNRDRTE